MNKEERLEKIIEIVRAKKRISIRLLEKLTFFSISTLRRDLIFLENQGLLTRKHGEVVLNSFNTVETSYFIRESEHKSEKKIIAQIAKDFIAPGMCIYLDSSTTVYELCTHLCTIENLIVFTNGLNTAQMLSEYANPTMKIFITGGEIKHHSSSVINHSFQDQLIHHFNIDLAICSARGIDREFVYEASLSQALSKKNIMGMAKETLLLIDSSKYYKTGFFKINNLSQYKAIISDDTPDTDLLEAVDLLGLEWISE